MIFVFAAGAWFPDAQNRAEDKETAQCSGFRENMRRQFLRQKISIKKTEMKTVSVLYIGENIFAIEKGWD